MVALQHQFLEDVGPGRPGARLRLLAARQVELAEQDVAELLRRADVEALAGEFVDLRLEAGEFLRELTLEDL